MKKLIKGCYFTLLSTVVLILSGCMSCWKVSSITDIDTDFSLYHTFAWLPDKIDTVNSPNNSEVIRNNIRNYLGQSFGNRGYTLNLDNPDLLLQIVITNQKKERSIYYTYPYYNCNYYYGSDYYYPYTFDYYYHHHAIYCYPADYYPDEFEFIENTVTLNVIDKRQNKMVWSSTGITDIYDSKYVYKNINPLIKAIMRKYPVKPIM